METTCIVCRRTFERGVGQARTRYCSNECRKQRKTAYAKASSDVPTPYTKKDGNWYCTYQGKQFYLGTSAIKAQEKLNQIVAGEVVSPSTAGPTIAALADQYLKGLANNQSPDTIRTKRMAFARFLEFIGPNALVTDASASKIEEFKQRRFALGNGKGTIRSKLLSLSSLFQYVVKQGIVKTNPLKDVLPLRQSSDPDPDHLTENEIENLLKLTEKQRYPWLEKRDKLVFLLMLHAGLRRIEVSNLKWSDVDLERNLIILRSTKGQKPRLIGISETLREALQDCIANWRKSEIYVITTQRGSHVSRESLSYLSHKYVDQMNHSYRGKKRFSLHSLRATLATQLASKGVGTRVIQGLLGHSDPRTTLRYAAYTEKMAVDSVRVLDT